MRLGLRLLLKRPASRLIARVTRSRRLAARLFGVRLRPLSDPSLYYFDVTTPVLVSVASRHVRPGMRVLDLGTGAAAIIGLALWRRHGCRVVAADINPSLVRSAREQVACNNAPIDVVESSFLDGVAGDLDLVTFNPPYVTTAHGSARGLDEPYRVQWDGGAEGTSVIARFLDAIAADTRRPLGVMGVNRWHATPERLEALFAARPGLTRPHVVRHPWLPVNVYVFQRAG